MKRVRVGAEQPRAARDARRDGGRRGRDVSRRAGGDGGSDLAVVFEPPQSSSTVLLTPRPQPTRGEEPEPDIPLEQAIANAAAITPKDAAGAGPGA